MLYRLIHCVNDSDLVMVYYRSSSKYSECLLKKKNIMKLLIYKMDLGLDKCVLR